MKFHELRKIAGQIGDSAGHQDQRQFREYLRSLGMDPDDLYQELEMTSRYVDTHRDVSYPDSTVQLHSHNFYELLHCSNTCGAEYLIDARRYRLQKGDIIIVPPGVSHRPLLPETMTEPYRRDVLWVSMDFFARLHEMFPGSGFLEKNDTFLIRTAGAGWESLGELFHRGVVEAETKQAGWEAALIANTMMLMVQMRRAVMDRSAHSLKAEKPELLDQVLAYIEDNLGSRITIGEAARKFYVSESTITQLFRRKLNVSFYRCVTQRRLIAAKSLIQEGLHMDSVSEQVGFSDYSSFYRAFKQEYGISPRQYRKLLESPD